MDPDPTLENVSSPSGFRILRDIHIKNKVFLINIYHYCYRYLTYSFKCNSVGIDIFNFFLNYWVGSGQKILAQDSGTIRLLIIVLQRVLIGSGFSEKFITKIL